MTTNVDPHAVTVNIIVFAILMETRGSYDALICEIISEKDPFCSNMWLICQGERNSIDS